MDLLVWQKYHPHQALGIILSLLEKAESDDQTCEMIALGPVQQIVELAEDSFVPLLREAVYRHPLFELCTRFKRQHTDSDRWFQIN